MFLCPGIDAARKDENLLCNTLICLCLGRSCLRVHLYKRICYPSSRPCSSTFARVAVEDELRNGYCRQCRWHRVGWKVDGSWDNILQRRKQAMLVKHIYVAKVSVGDCLPRNLHASHQ